MSGTETATSGAGATAGYVHPEVLVSTSWVAEHLNDSSIRLIEADEDVLLYEIGHLPGPNTSTIPQFVSSKPMKTCCYTK
jgi:thiosulfate/3-mercaptopyruvate sulfurtransferase